jgi:hypothetical protein
MTADRKKEIYAKYVEYCDKSGNPPPKYPVSAYTADTFWMWDNFLNQLDESINSDDQRMDESADDYADFKKAAQANPTYKKAAGICKKYGFDLAELAYVSPGGYVNFRVISDSKKFQPDIYYGSSFGGKAKFEIQTVSFGALDLKEYPKFLEACENAYKMVQELNKLDLSTLQLSPK